MEGIVIDANVFVATGFNPRSASARVLAAVREGRFHLIWNKSTRRETEMILRRIRRLDVAAPLGLDDVFAMVIRPNRALDNAVSHRHKAQRAQAIWPEV
jgi:hypothetical protein